MVLDAFKSPEPEPDSESPKEEQPRSPKWLPVFIANTGWVIVGLLVAMLVLGSIGRAFGPMAMVKSFFYSLLALVGLISFLSKAGRI